MAEQTYPYAGAQPRAGAASYGALLAQTMFLVVVAIAFLVAGSFVSQDFSQGAGLGFTIAGAAFLFVSGFVPALRHGALGMGVLFVGALLLGLGLGPILNYYLAANPAVVTQAGATTALVVAGAGTVGSLMAKDLRSWMRPLFFVMLAAVAVSWGMFMFGVGGTASVAISGVIGVVSAIAIVVYFNVLRKHATEDDVVWLATGIFLGIYNIFVSLLSIFGNR